MKMVMCKLTYVHGLKAYAIWARTTGLSCSWAYHRLVGLSLGSLVECFEWGRIGVELIDMS